MRPSTLSRNDVQRYARLLPLLLFALLAVASCRTTEEPLVDRTPPAMPDLTRMRATSPDSDGNVTVSGAAACVESASRVIVRQSAVSSPISRSAAAAPDGSFTVAIPAQSLEQLEVVAEDEAGNASRAAVLAVGAPFTLERQGSASPQAVAGETLTTPLSVRVTDESGTAVANVSVLLQSPHLTPTETSATSDANGLVSWSVQAPTLAVTASVEAVVDVALLAAAVNWDLQVEAAAADRLRLVSGSEQIAAPATAVADPLRVQVQDAYGNAIVGAPLSWVAAAGTLTNQTTATDVNGLGSAEWTLPMADGEYEVEVTTSLLPAEMLTIVGVAGGPPQVDAYTPDPALAGVSMTIAGSGFSREASYNEVGFPGTQGSLLGEVQSATPTELVVLVPPEAVGGDLSVQVCGRSAAPMALRIDSALGTPMDVPIGFDSARLETPTGNEEFVLAVYSDATSTGSFSIDSTSPAKVGSIQDSPATVRTTTVDDALHRWLRLQERQTRALPRVRSSGRAGKPIQEASFTVLAHLSGASYESVTATLRYQGNRALIYVDNRVLANELSDADVASMGSKFDTPNGSYWSVRNNFGTESDVDSDAMVTILLTPTVNGLTPPGSSGFVGGFFFSQDLHVTANSNNREILYGMVPDPTGRWGNVFPKSPTLDVLDSVLPHELQHLVNYNHHVLVRGGDPEELWLNEAMSHVAEDLSGFPDQNILRANLFLQAPQLVSMTTAGNALEERGMSYLFTRYVADHAGNGLLQDLTQTNVTGVDNIANASGRPFMDWMRDWSATLVLEQEGLAVAPYVYTSLDLSADFSPPATTALSLEAPALNGTLPVSGVRYFHLTGTSQPSTDLEISGDVRAIVMRIR